MTVLQVTAPSGRVIPTCDVHWMGPCPCRRCNAEGLDAETGEDCPLCGGDGCDPDVREDCQPEE